MLLRNEKAARDCSEAALRGRGINQVIECSNERQNSSKQEYGNNVEDGNELPLRRIKLLGGRQRKAP
jgi:hypothetical protein